MRSTARWRQLATRDAGTRSVRLRFRAGYATQVVVDSKSKPTPSSLPGPVLVEDELETKLLDQLNEKGVFNPPHNPMNLSPDSVGLSEEKILSITRAMFQTRIAHNVSRRAALNGKVHYTIGPGGHESIASLAVAARVTDPAMLHYRDTSFQLMRAYEAGQDPSVALEQLMRSYVVSREDKITGGRHKALGDADLNIIPTTSTIASHMSRFVGLATSFPLTRRLKIPAVYPYGSVAIGSFGDASINHATFRAGVNYLSYTSEGLHRPCPALTVVSDNKIGISVPSPVGWVEHNLKSTGLPYYRADGCNILDVYSKSVAAMTSARSGVPAFLHLECTRLFNHAGSDAGQYTSPETRAEYVSLDPLPATCGLLLELGLATHGHLRDMYESIHEDTEEMLAAVLQERKLETVDEVQAAVLPDPAVIRARRGDLATKNPTPSIPMLRKKKPLIMKQHITGALYEGLAEDPSVVLFGEDIGVKGGNYGVTDGLQKKFGRTRVIDTFLDETSILGMANGFALNNILPVAEICYLAYIHNAIDQLRGEASTLSFFSNRQYSNGMIVRVSGGGLTEFGGHFHNENSLASLLDMPGVVVLYPSNGADYTRLFRMSRELAGEQGRVVVVVEPIKTYATRKVADEYAIPWDSHFPTRDEVATLGLYNTYPTDKQWVGGGSDATKKGTSNGGGGDGDTEGKRDDVAIVTYGNGTWLSIHAQQILKEKHNIRATVFETPVLRGGTSGEDMFARLRQDYTHVLFADESREQGCPSHEAISSLVSNVASETGGLPKVGLVAAANSFLPLGEAAKVEGLYLSERRIVEAMLRLTGVY